MKNRKFVKPALIVVAMVLVCVLSVLGTLAYLQSTTEVAVNTFTVGNVEITLDEAVVDEYGVADNEAARVLENTYKLIPAHTYTKDPIIHVDADSEDAYIGAVITVKGASALKAKGIEADDFLGANGFNLTVKSGWTVVKIDDKSSIADNAYVYALVYSDKVSADADVTIFDAFTAPNMANGDLATLGNTIINVQGYAIQADGFTAAGNALYTGFNTVFPQA